MREVLSGEAYVLHQRPYRETSSLLELFTPDYGRVGVVARGLRGSRATARRAVLQPLQPLRAELLRQGELAQLQDAEAAGPRLQPSGDALLACLYVNELTLRLVPRNEALAGLFWTYAACLGQLESGHSLATHLRNYERALLDAIGYGLQLHNDSSGAVIAADAHYRFAEVSVPSRVSEQHPQAISGRALLEFADGLAVTGRDGVVLRNLLRRAIAAQLGGRPLQSWGLLDALSRSGARTPGAGPATATAPGISGELSPRD